MTVDKLPSSNVGVVRGARRLSHFNTDHRSVDEIQHDSCLWSLSPCHLHRLPRRGRSHRVGCHIFLLTNDVH